MYYTDVERYLTPYLGDENPAVPNWFNFVRNPVTRFESGFYYRRSDLRWNKIYSNLPNKV